MSENSSGEPQVRQVPVWDIFVRIFHWSLVVSFVGAYFTGDERDLAHEIIGYGVITLVVIRVLWGFFGSRYARFTDFIYRPSAVLAFLRSSAIACA